MFASSFLSDMLALVLGAVAIATKRRPKEVDDAGLP
jgi:hypothetical protein